MHGVCSKSPGALESYIDCCGQARGHEGPASAAAGQRSRLLHFALALEKCGDALVITLSGSQCQGCLPIIPGLVRIGFRIEQDSAQVTIVLARVDEGGLALVGLLLEVRFRLNQCVARSTVHDDDEPQA